jgi:formylglycine-generating enzyme required for sulfatase activity
VIDPPSEAEWEYACRAGTTSPYAFGDTISKDQVNHNQPYKQTTPVGQFPPNDWGLYDMHGNVWEWCQDHRGGGCRGTPTDGSAWEKAFFLQSRIQRGGSWFSAPRNCRSAYRNYFYPDLRYYIYGFRVCCSAPRTL